VLLSAWTMGTAADGAAGVGPAGLLLPAGGLTGAVVQLASKLATASASARRL
jgi:hypothetical protein